MDNFFKIRPRFSVGNRVGDSHSRRVGVITKVWSKLVAIDQFTYKAEISYTVTPDKSSYNSFRVLESNIRNVGSDPETGEEFLLPEEVG